MPAVNTVGSGRVSTDVPRARATLLALLPSAPWLVRYLPLAGRMRMSAGMIQGCKVVAANGQVLTEMSQAQGEGFTVATVALADARPQPRGAQPASRVPAFAYVSSDVVLPQLVEPVYRSGVRRAWGAHMAPGARRVGASGAAFVLGLLFSLLVRYRQRRHGC